MPTCIQHSEFTLFKGNSVSIDGTLYILSDLPTWSSRFSIMHENGCHTRHPSTLYSDSDTGLKG